MCITKDPAITISVSESMTSLSYTNPQLTMAKRNGFKPTMQWIKSEFCFEPHLVTQKSKVIGNGSLMAIYNAKYTRKSVEVQ